MARKKKFQITETVTWYKTKYGAWHVTYSEDLDGHERSTAAANEANARQAARDFLDAVRLPHVEKRGLLYVVERTREVSRVSGWGDADE